MNKTYKRIVLFLLLAVGIVPAVFPADIWIHRFDTSSTIDLASQAFWYPTNVWSATASKGNGSYGDGQIVAVVGIQGSDKETTVTFSSDWYLTSVSNPKVRRPFSVCLVPRVNQKNYPNPNSYSYTKYGYLGQDSVNSFTLPKTDGTTTNIGSYTYENVKSAWIDVVFVLDPVLTADGKLPNTSEDICNVVPGDDYLGQMMVTVQSGGQVESTVFYMNGYYGADYKDSVSSAQLVVTPDTVNASSFKIVENVGIPIKIADIDFTTTSSLTQPNDYYLFVSSSPDISGQGSRFEFKRRGSTGTSNDYNSRTYQITATATTGSVPSKAFDGTMRLGSSSPDDWMKAKQTSYVTGNGRGTIFNTDFHGSLWLTVTGNVENLLAGAYDTNIYIHAVTAI